MEVRSDRLTRVMFDDPRAVSVLSDCISDCIEREAEGRPIVVACVGTDRSTGDALGPLVGSLLRGMGLSPTIVFGTLDEPIHAANIHDAVETIRSIAPESFVIAVDACLGNIDNVGSVNVDMGPLRPGAGVNKELPPIGDVHITGIVNVGGYMEYFVLQNTRLSFVFRMAGVIALGLNDALSRVGLVGVDAIEAAVGFDTPNDGVQGVDHAVISLMNGDEE